jgi:TRAP-type C4-dicarboxylate transport system permease small subunit
MSSPPSAAPNGDGPWARTLGWVSGAFELVAAVGVLGLMLFTVTHVLLRTTGGRGIAGGVEIIEVTLVIVVFLGLAYAQRTDVHVSTTVVTERLPRRLSLTLECVGMLVALLLIAWMTYETAKRGIDAWQAGERRVGLRDVPVWPARLIVPIGLSALALEMLATLLRRGRELTTRSTG